MSAIVKFENVTKKYNLDLYRKKITALDELNVTIEEGKVFGLLGPNGSGKTTTIKLLLGLLRPSSGLIEVFGLSPRSNAVKRKVGYLPEETYLYPFLSARETIRFYAKLSGSVINNLEARITEILSLIGLTKAADRHVKQYSKGMLRRLGLALVMVKDPDLYILDEPTIGLDPLAVQDFKKMLLRLKENGKTIILSSHLLGEIENVCNDVVILYQGKMLKQGPLEEILVIKDLMQLTLKANEFPSKQKLEEIFSKTNCQIAQYGHPKKTLEQAFIEILNL